MGIGVNTVCELFLLILPIFDSVFAFSRYSNYSSKIQCFPKRNPEPS